MAFCFKWSTNILSGCHISKPSFLSFCAGKKWVICSLSKVPKALCSEVIKSDRMIMDHAFCLCTWEDLIYNIFYFQVLHHKGETNLYLRWGTRVRVTRTIIIEYVYKIISYNIQISEKPGMENDIIRFTFHYPSPLNYIYL